MKLINSLKGQNFSESRKDRSIGTRCTCEGGGAHYVGKGTAFLCPNCGSWSSMRDCVLEEDSRRFQAYSKRKRFQRHVLGENNNNNNTFLWL